MLTAPVAKLLQLQPLRLCLAVLRSRIVPLFAITALHCNDLSGHTKKLLAFSSKPTSKNSNPLSFRTALAVRNLLCLCGAGALARVPAAWGFALALYPLLHLPRAYALG